MFSSASPRRLLFLVLAATLAFPSYASAAPWEIGSLLAKAGGFFSALWSPVSRAQEPRRSGGDAAGSLPLPGGPRTSHPTPEKNDGVLVGDHGCEIMPDGHCAT